jgi:uncharacterized protein YecA (UPF0149 family)
MEKTLEEKLANFGMPHGHQPVTPEAGRKTLEVLETLKQCLGYKTVDVREWSYTGGRTTQTVRVGELAQLGDKAITAIRKLAETGYQIDTYWDDGGSIGEGDITIIKKLSDEKVMERYLSIVSQAQGLFKNKAFFYYAENALAMISLLDFKEEDAEKAIRFLRQSNCQGFFNKKTYISPFLLESIIRSDEKITTLLLEKLKQNYGYKTVEVKEWEHTKGHTGQIRRILEISRLGENALKVLDILSYTGYKLDTYWDDKGSIGEEDLTVIQMLLNEETLKKYLNVLSKAENSSKKFEYQSENAMSMMILSKFSEEEYSKVINFLNDGGYFDFFNQRHTSLSRNTLENIMKHDDKKLKKIMEKLRQGFNYKTVKAQDFSEIGGVTGQITRILELSEIENSANIIEKLAKTGYKLDNYWEPKGALRREDIQVFDTLSKFNISTKQENLERYVEIIDEIKKTFKQPKMNHNAANAMSITKLLGRQKEETSTIIRFLKYCDCPDFFNGHSELPKDLITSIAFSDINILEKILQTLNKRFNYKTVNVKKWEYTGGSPGQIRRVLEISDFGERAVKALEAIAESGYKLNVYWDSGGSIGEDEVRAIRKLVEADSVEKYTQVIKGLRKLGYKVKPDLERTIEITMIPESVNALDLLYLNYNYKLDEEKIREEDIRKIKKLGEELFDKRLEKINVKIEHKCLYKEDAEAFIKLFKNLKNVNDKKKIIKSLLNCPHENKEAIKWLDENEPELIREVGVLS